MCRMEFFSLGRGNIVDPAAWWRGSWRGETSRKGAEKAFGSEGDLLRYKYEAILFGILFVGTRALSQLAVRPGRDDVGGCCVDGSACVRRVWGGWT